VLAALAGCGHKPSAVPSADRHDAAGSSASASLLGASPALAPQAAIPAPPVGTADSAVFACQRLQTYCGGIDRYVAICRAGDLTLIIPAQMFQQARFAAATFQRVAPRRETIEVQTCAGAWTQQVTVTAKAVAHELADDRASAEAALERQRAAP
jgi:hypothetical protein